MLRAARCVVVLLSRRYLSRPDSLQELCWAVDHRYSRGAALLLVSVDPSISAASIASWTAQRTLRGMSRVSDGEPVQIAIDPRTVRFVQQRLGKERIWLEWADGEGARSRAKDGAVLRMMDSVPSALRPAGMRVGPRLEVRDADGRPPPGGWKWAGVGSGWHIHDSSSEGRADTK